MPFFLLTTMATAPQDLSVASPPRYRSISPWAVLSVVCGAASVLMIFGWPLAFLPLAAIYFGLKARGQIERVPEEYTGQRPAKIGIGLGAGLGILLGGCLIFFNNEVPHGYLEIKDYSILEPNPNNKTELVPPSALELDQKKTKVYVRGYMLPGRRQTGLTEFSICRTADQCRFAQKSYRPTDLIRVKLSGDRTIDYTTHQIGVGGIFHVDLQSLSGTPYSIDGDYLYP